MRMQWILGADPGKHGAIVLINAEKNSGEYQSEDVVCIPSKVNMGKLDVSYIFNELKPYAKDIVYAMQEHVHAIFGSSAKGSFEFGDANGALRAAIEMSCLAAGNPQEVHLVPPKMWQKIAWYGTDVVADPKLDKTTGKPIILKSGKPKLDVDTKKTSSNAAHTIFPGVSFVMPRCRNEHDGCVDAALIAYYGSVIRFKESVKSQHSQKKGSGVCRFRL